MPDRWTCDVVLALDLRGAASTVVGATRSLDQAGYRVGLLHLGGHASASAESFPPAVLGLLRQGIQLLVGTRPVETRALMVVDAAVGAHARGALARVRAERTVADWDWNAEVVGDGAPSSEDDDGHGLVQRMRQLIGPPSGRPKTRRIRALPRPVVLFASSNGAGLGHLTRLMSMARRTVDVQPVFFTLSQAVPVVRAMQFPCEYFASAGYSGMPTAIWNRLYAQRLGELIETYRPKAVVFDGTYPFQGLVDVANRWPDVPFVWSRRGMWIEGRGALGSVERARHFRLVIEPGELASEFDRGLTASRRGEALQVAPVVLLDREELLPADEARAHLGLASDRPAVLVTLGAGNINDVVSTVDLVVRELALHRDAQVCVTSSIIADRQASTVADSIHTISEYPLSRSLRAFDCAVSASGYNSFHELVAFGVPTLFLPNLETSLDDQVGRARSAARSGVGLWLEEEADDASLRASLAALLDPERRAQMRTRCAEVWPGNGAADAMRAIEALAGLRAADAAGA